MTEMKSFLDYSKIEELSALPEINVTELNEILEKALKMRGLTAVEAAKLLSVSSSDKISALLNAARKVKEEIYGSRMVLFAPLYTGNKCSNNCLYCSFRAGNKDIKRVRLSLDEIASETENILKQGHKRLLLLCGESSDHPLEYTMDAIKTSYGVRIGNSSIRRINVEIAPMSFDDFSILKTAGIGTYTCFQETYNPELYKKYHLSGPKKDYEKRLYVMDTAMKAGIEDVGIGALFGLGDYKYEVISLLEHASHLEKTYGCGPHTISVPRIEPAHGAPLTENVPNRVTDDDFRKIIAVLRLSVPYTGIILSTRENAVLRKELFHYGVSQASAGSKTNPGGYQNSDEDNGQFTLGDHRGLDEVISDMIDDGFIPSFCTGCYRMGRVGNDFMDMAKPGLIKHYCMPNGIVSFSEYLLDYASKTTSEKGFKLIEELTSRVPVSQQKIIRESLEKTIAGQRDIYL